MTKVIMDPLSFEVSHIVVSMNGASERQVPMGAVQTVMDDLVQLRSSSSEVLALPPFKRDDYVTLHEIEVPGLEKHIDVTPGEVLVPLPELERNVKRRKFFANLTYVMGLFIGLPLVYPVLKYVMKPMFAPFDNQWQKIGNVGKIKADDTGTQFEFKHKVKEAYLPEAEIEKNVWIVKATPAVLEKVYQGKDMEFRDATGKTLWTNKKDIPFIAFSGKCPHLGCGYKWRKHKVLGPVFLCPCHVSIYDASGKVIEGPAPRPLDVLPIQVTESGEVQIIDMEFKAGTRVQSRMV
ncbi:MAG: putative Quinol-cytochrome c reductase, Rieske iron-sulfur subunit [Nitrospira sp.]|nr:MAG: putative Quinol-cytochrome c reductase, Rieske iron-sulfur subunit [Nitrospira sp.]